MRTRSVLLGSILAGAVVLGLAAPATAAPQPSPTGEIPTSTSSTTLRGERAGLFAAAVRQRLADKRIGVRTTRSVKLTSEPSVLTMFGAETTMGTFVVANAGGDLVWRYWTTDRGWSEWVNEGGEISGRPAVALDTGGKLNFFAVSGGRLKICDMGAWADFGVATTSDPVTVENWTNSHLQVYVTNADGEVMERFQDRHGSWSGWGNLGGEVTVGTVTPYFNRYNGNVQLYANSNGKLTERYWNVETGWSRWNTFAGEPLSTAPSALYNSTNRNTQVYAANARGEVVEMYWDARSGRWIGWGNLGGSTTDRPEAFHNRLNGNVEIYTTTTGGAVHEKYWDARTGRWTGWSSIGGRITGSPTVSLNYHLPNVQVMARSADGDLTENVWSPGKPWTGWRTITG